MWQEEFAPRHSIVDGEKKTLTHAGGDGFQQFALVAAELGPKAHGALGQAGVRERMRGGFEGKTGFVRVHLDFMPATFARLENIERQGVEKLVGKMDSNEFGEVLRFFDPTDIPCRECGGLFFTQKGNRLDDCQGDPGQRRLRKSGEDVV